MQVKIQFVGPGAATNHPGRFPALQPALASGLLGTALTRQGQCHGDKGIEQPDHGGGAHQPDTPAVDAVPLRQMQGEVQLVEEGHQVFRVQGDLAPQAFADDLAGDRIHEGMVIVQLIAATRFRIHPGVHPDFRVVAGFWLQMEKAGAYPGVGLLHPVHQFQHGQRLPFTLALEQVRVEPFIQLVVPGNQRPGQAGNNQKAGNKEAEPAMKNHQNCAHGAPVTIRVSAAVYQ